MLFCGIDVAQHSHAVLVVDNAGRVVQPSFFIENRRESFDRLATILAALSEPVAISMEATGHYWLALYDDLTRRGYPVTVINSLQVAAYHRSGVRKVKGDRTDAFWVSDFLHIASPPPISRDIPALLRIRELTRFRFWLTDQIDDCKRKILCILDRVSPEDDMLFFSAFLASSRALLKEAATAQEIADFDLAELTELLHKTSRDHFGQPKAQAIQSVAERWAEWASSWMQSVSKCAACFNRSTSCKSKLLRSTMPWPISWARSRSTSPPSQASARSLAPPS